MKGLSRPVRYFCTAGKGMEQFLLEELRCKLAATDVDHVTGKVFFSTTVDVAKVRGLKSAERLFLLLRRAPSLSRPGSAGRLTSQSLRRVEDVVQDWIIGDEQVWAEALALWRGLQRALEEAGPDPAAPGRGRKRKLEPGEGGGGGLDCGGPGEGEGRGPGAERRSPEEKRRHSGVEGRGPEEKRWDSGVEGQGPEEKRRGPEEKRRDSGAEGRGPGLEGRGSGAPPRSESPSKEGGAREPRPAPVSFRVSCSCRGSYARRFGSQELGRIVGFAISRKLGWSVNLREPDLEVNVHLSDDHCVIGLPLLRSPLASRSYIRTAGLRSTVAWAMASLAEIKPGSRVLDPMCGAGTILLEAAQECPDAFFLGMDIEETQLEKAGDNVQFAARSERIHLLKSSVKAIPVPSGIMDAIVCDVPFGRKFGSKADMVAGLPTIMAEMERVLCVGGVLVLLLSPDLAFHLKRSCRALPAPPPGPGAPPPATAPPKPAAVPPPPGPGGPHPPPPLLFPSLELQSLHRVSLGTADALIHKYRKCIVHPMKSAVTEETDYSVRGIQ